MSIVGCFLFSFLLVIRIDQMIRSGMYLPGTLLILQAGLVAFRMIFRKPSLRESRWLVQVLAWLSSVVPFIMLVPNQTLLAWMSAPGLVLMLWSLWSLGSSFSIAPADRNLVEYGPYRIIRHPMYAGEILSLLGLCIGSRLLWNWTVLCVFVLSVSIRIFQEESLVDEYPAYAERVMWRMIPGVW